MHWIPNAITAGNAIMGFAAILAASEKKFSMVAMLIFLGWILDTMDGMVARKLGVAKLPHDLFGKEAWGIEYDSLNDVVTFAVAPATAIYWFMEGPVGFLLGGWYMACAIFRLTRFNVTILERRESTMTYGGLASPAAAIIVAATIASNATTSEVGVVGVVAGLLMVSNYCYYTVKQLFAASVKIKISIGLLILAVFLINRNPYQAVALLGVIYALHGPLGLAR